MKETIDVSSAGPSGYEGPVSGESALAATDEVSRRRPDGGGLRSGLSGVQKVLVPGLVSVLASALTVFALLGVLGWAVAAFDARLATVLTGSSLPGSKIFAALSLTSLSVAVVQSFRLPLTPSGDATPYLRRERRRFRVVMVALTAALVFGVCWAAGRI